MEDYEFISSEKTDRKEAENEVLQKARRLRKKEGWVLKGVSIDSREASDGKTHYWVLATMVRTIGV